MADSRGKERDPDSSVPLFFQQHQGCSPCISFLVDASLWGQSLGSRDSSQTQGRTSLTGGGPSPSALIATMSWGKGEGIEQMGAPPANVTSWCQPAPHPAGITLPIQATAVTSLRSGLKIAPCEGTCFPQPLPAGDSQDLATGRAVSLWRKVSVPRTGGGEEQGRGRKPGLLGGCDFGAEVGSGIPPRGRAGAGDVPSLCGADIWLN